MSGPITEANDIELADFIIKYTEENGFPPSRRQMIEHFGWASPQTAQARLLRLIDAGIVERSPGIPRGIKVNRERLHEFGGAS